MGCSPWGLKESNTTVTNTRRLLPSAASLNLRNVEGNPEQHLWLVFTFTFKMLTYNKIHSSVYSSRIK